MNAAGRILLTLSALAALSIPGRAGTVIDLGSAGKFAVLAGSKVTNTGSTVITGGDVGVAPGTAITGFASVDGGPGVIAAPNMTHADDAQALQAQSDLTAAYNFAAGLTKTQTLTGDDLGGLTLKPGVYYFASTAQLTGQLTLDYGGNPNAQFVFQIGTALTTAANSSVVTINDGGSTTPGASVFWQVGSSATFGAGTLFEGHILANQSITVGAGANFQDGSALAEAGAVTLSSNMITNAVSVPEPSTMVLALAGAAVLGLSTYRKRV